MARRKEDKPLKHRFVRSFRLPKLLMQQPIGREYRAHRHSVWEAEGVKKGKEPTQWRTTLPGNEYITLLWKREGGGPSGRHFNTIRPGWRPEPRLPHGVDMSCLYHLLGFALRANPVEIYDLRDLSLQGRFGKKQHDAPFPDYRDAEHQRAAIYMWMRLHILVHRPQRDTFWFFPPVAEIEELKPKRHFKIYMDEEWLRLCRRNYKGRFPPDIPLPLPFNASVQNIILRTMLDGSMDDYPINTFHAITTGSAKAGTVLKPRKDNVYHTPLVAWQQAIDWYIKWGGRLERQRAPYTEFRKSGKHGGPKMIPSSTFSTRVKRPKVK